MKKVAMYVHFPEGDPAEGPDEWLCIRYEDEALDGVLMRMISDSPDYNFYPVTIRRTSWGWSHTVMACETREAYERYMDIDPEEVI
jgi:hypothetical protein